MSKLSVDQTSIKRLFEDKKSDFLIPDYQRPYAWTETECLTLWEDLFEFAFPEKDNDKFTDDEYYLGPIVTFKNDDNKLEIIDGQQRLTTLMLLLRAFVVKFKNAQDKNTILTRQNIEKCIWKTDEFGNPDINRLKIDSEVATDNDKDEFLDILKTGEAKKELRSKYAINYRFFQEKIAEFVDNYSMYVAYFPIRILNNCILLPIEADDQDTALRIFSTLNDRGLPLSDADIFKAQFYKYYSKKGQKDNFIEKWKSLEEIADKIFNPAIGTPMDELFTRYMYYERAKMGIKASTTEALRKFYEKDYDGTGAYSLLNKDETLENLICLADFWKDVINQNKDRFSERILKKLFILNYAPNSMWTYFLTVYFMHNRNDYNLLNENELYNFLNKSIAFIWAYGITNPGVNALRTPVYAEMVNIVQDRDVSFNDFKFEEDIMRKSIDNYSFWNQRPITKSMLVWWAFEEQSQELLKLDEKLEIEHIYARNRYENEHTLSNTRYLDMLGNKSILEKRINIRASDYRFVDKKKYYNGFENSRGAKKEGTKIIELVSLANTKGDFIENDIIERNRKMIEKFLNYLFDNGLLR